MADEEALEMASKEREVVKQARQAEQRRQLIVKAEMQKALEKMSLQRPKVDEEGTLPAPSPKK